MIAIAIGQTPSIAVRFSGANAARYKPVVKAFVKGAETGERLIVDANFYGKAFVVGAGENGPDVDLELIWLENPTVEMERRSTPRTMAQNDTLRGIERFVAWAMLGRRPTKRETEFVHEAILEDAAPKILNPVTQRLMPKRTSMMDTKEMSKCIEHALVMLGIQDISADVMAEIGGDMHRLWSAWYSWRYSTEDPLFEEEQKMDWSEYCSNHPVCEICGVMESENDPLERIHIVSGGSDIGDYEEPWNWIRGHHSHHVRQHQLGWDVIINEHPHLKGKIDRAKTLAGKRSL